MKKIDSCGCFNSGSYIYIFQGEFHDGSFFMFDSFFEEITVTKEPFDFDEDAENEILEVIADQKAYPYFVEVLEILVGLENKIDCDVCFSDIRYFLEYVKTDLKQELF